MRSLTLKLTLAFLFVGLIGALLVAVFVGLRTQSEFGQFVSDRYQQDLIDELGSYYQQNGSWDGIDAIAFRLPPRHPGDKAGYMRAPVALVDNTDVVVYGSQRYQIGQKLTRSELRQAIPVEVNGQVVGSMVLDLPAEADRRADPSPEADFLRRINLAILLSALGATAIALVLGILLARAISRPVRELTEATQIVALGDFGHQVPVRTQDELGELAKSFNQMSADLAQASQLRRQMTADIAHELRTPLSVILGYTEALSDGKLHGSPGMYQAMYGEAQLLSHLVDDLRTLSLADAGELTLNRLPVAPGDCLERTAASQAALAAHQSVEVRVQVAPNLPLIEADRERIAQVLGNLMSNALRYTPAGGTITLSAEAGAESVLLRVSDTGPGIEPDHLPHIFQRFYRADESRTTNDESGLGLAIAKSLVEAHGGTITVESTVGQGTTFTVALPASAQAPTEG